MRECEFLAANKNYEKQKLMKESLTHWNDFLDHIKRSKIIEG